MTDLFDWQPYNGSPGFKAPGPSREAAEAMKPTAASLRAACHGVLESTHGLTADEVAGVLDESILSIRPRITELKELGIVEDSGVRRLNASGKRATVWRVKRDAQGPRAWPSKKADQ